MVKSQIEEILQNIDATVAVTEGEESSETATGTSQRVKMTIDERLRALIVLGSLEDLDFIEKLIDKIDVPTKQILIEAFVVEAGSKFDKELGAKLGAKLGPIGIMPGSSANEVVTIGGVTGGAATALALGGTTGLISNQSVGGATGSLGILVDTSALDLQIELTALEQMGISKIISNPKVFTLDNETAIITQGIEIPYQTVGAEGTETEFKEAALKLEVTPSIVGDGNIIMEVKINKDSANTSIAGGTPSVNKTEITTKLLIADGTIVVIGGIYTESLSDTVSKTPLLSALPFIGNLFKKVKKDDDLDRLLIFIAPRIL
jgi:type IV pilus assembly protein PilQ